MFFNQISLKIPKSNEIVKAIFWFNDVFFFGVGRNEVNSLVKE